MIILVLRRQRQHPGAAGQEQAGQLLHLAARIVERHQQVMGRNDRDIFPLDRLFGERLEHRNGFVARRQGQQRVAPRIERAFDNELDIAGDRSHHLGGIIEIPPFEHGFVLLGEIVHVKIVQCVFEFAHISFRWCCSRASNESCGRNKGET